MIPWQEVDRGAVGTADETLSLHRRGDEWSIRSAGVELMNSRRSGSERALAEIAAGNAREAEQIVSRVLVGGLGLGHTLAAALESFPSSRVLVAEISPKVVGWNRGPLGDLAGRPLDDPRVEVLEEDVVSVMDEAGEGRIGRFDWLLLDVDNGPEALSRSGNDALYSDAGLARIRRALTDSGALAVWSAGPSAAFEGRLAMSGWSTQSHRVSPRVGGRGRARHTIWIARGGRH